MLQVLVKSISERELGEGGREGFDRVVEFLIKDKGEERGREVVDRLIKGFPKNEFR